MFIWKNKYRKLVISNLCVRTYTIEVFYHRLQMLDKRMLYSTTSHSATCQDKCYAKMATSTLRERLFLWLHAT